eukprot:gene10975-22932_t
MNYRSVVVGVIALILATCVAGMDDANWVLKAKSMEKRVFSQGGQDGVLEYVFNNINSTNQYFVEFGFNSDNYEHGSGANTANLFAKGWKGLLLDGAFSNDSINLHKEWITPDNICSLFRKYKVPISPDYVSIDIDSVDLWLFRAILKCNYKPRVVSVEYNSNFHPSSFLTCDIYCKWNGDSLYGASFGALNLVAKEYGYTAIAVITYLDIVFVRNDLLTDANFPKRIQFKGIHKPLHKFSTMEAIATHLLDYNVFQSTSGNVSEARREAISQKNNYKLLLTRPSKEKK